MIHTRYDSWGRLVGLVYSQGTTVLASYAWTYSESGGQWSVVGGQSDSCYGTWVPNGGLPIIGSVGAGEGMLPVHDTTSIGAALAEGAYYGTSSLLTSCTSSDGTVTYSYDPTGQLIGADYSGSQSDECYSYDSNGNRTNPGYVTGTGNRLLSDGTYRYTYDEDGNRTARFIDADQDGVLDAGDTDITEYTWDSRHRLATVTNYATEGGTPTQIVHYFYDLENRWIGETIDTNGDGVVDHQTAFVYDGNQIVLKFDKDGTGDVTSANLSHRYLWGPAVDQVLADEQVTNPQTPGNVVWPVTDNLGTVRDLALYDAQTGATSVANHRVYDSFGNLKSQTNAAVDCLFGFTGRPFNENAALQNNLNRWYDAKTGRWIGQDRIGFTGCQTNLYAYVGNNATNRTDPTGCAPSIGVIRRELLAEFERLRKNPFITQNQMVAALIAKALKLTSGDAELAWGVVMQIRENPDVDNDIWASVDHFFQSWKNGSLLRIPSPFGGTFSNPFSSYIAMAVADGYGTLKMKDWSRENLLPRDHAGKPPSPWTPLKRYWAHRGALLSSTDPFGYMIGTIEWSVFLRMLEKWSKE